MKKITHIVSNSTINDLIIYYRTESNIFYHFFTVDGDVYEYRDELIHRDGKEYDSDTMKLIQVLEFMTNSQVEKISELFVSDLELAKIMIIELYEKYQEERT